MLPCLLARAYLFCLIHAVPTCHLSAPSFPYLFHRQQQERLRQIEADADAERRRKQAEQQAQLKGLYRQQEEALQRRRGGGGGSGGGVAASRESGVSVTPRRRSDGQHGIGASVGVRLDERESPGAPAYATASPENDPWQSSPPGFGPPGSQRGLARGQFDTADNNGANFSGGNASRRIAPRTRRSLSDVDDLPAGAQARKEILQISPTMATTAAAAGLSESDLSLRRGYGGGDHHPSEYGGERDIAGKMPESLPRTAGAASVLGVAAMEDSGASRACDGSRYSAGARRERRSLGTGADYAGAASGEYNSFAFHATAASTMIGDAHNPRRSFMTNEDEPPLRTRSSLVPVSSQTLFPKNPSETPGELLAADHNAKEEGQSVASYSNGRDTQHLSDAEAIAAAAVEGSKTNDANDGNTRGGDGSFAREPQDEVDAFMTSWQTDHFRRRGHRNGSLGDAQVGQAVAEHDGCATPWLDTAVPRSPRRYVPRSPGARSVKAAAESVHATSGDREEGELEKSLVATSRMTESHIPLHLQARAGDDSRLVGGRRRRRGTRESQILGELEEEENMNASERSLTSDSMLFFLSGNQEQDSRDPPAAPVHSTEATAAAAPDVTDYDNNEKYTANSLGGPSPSTMISTGKLLSRGRDAGRLQEEEEDGSMSPLTRLLAETPVRLEAGGGPRRRHQDSGTCISTCS